jgi:hypothetical protein
LNNIMQRSNVEVAERLSIMIEGAPEYQQIKSESKMINRFHFISAGELCKKPNTDNWIIKDILEKNVLADLFGDSGSAKSFLGFDIGLCAAKKMDWQGFEVKQSGSVFYIAGEGLGGINRRIKAHASHYGYDLADVPFFVSDRAARITECDSIAEIQTAIDELKENHGDPILIVIDTLNRNFGNGDENSTADMTRFIAGIDDIRSRYSCAVLIIHHSGLSATERARGASALRAALDWEYRLTKNADGTRTLTCTKSKDHAPPEPLSFKLEEVKLDWQDEDGEQMTSCILRRIDNVSEPGTRPLSGAKKIAFDCLRSLGGDGVDIDDWRLACYTAGISPTSSTDAKRKAFKRAVSELRDFGHVRATNDLWSIKADNGQRADIGRTCPGA